MKLFFGTDLYELVDIINDKKISTEKFGCWTCDTDILLEKYLGKEFVSKKPINLSDDEEFIFIVYEYYIDIDTNDLDTDKLFVGNRHLRLDIQDAKSEEEALQDAIAAANAKQKEKQTFGCWEKEKEKIFFTKKY